MEKLNDLKQDDPYFDLFQRIYLHMKKCYNASESSYRDEVDQYAFEMLEECTEIIRNQAEQICKLSDFIMFHVAGEPSESEGAIDCAIRIMRAQGQELNKLRLKYGCLETAIYETCPSAIREYVFEEQQKRLNNSI